MKFPSYAAAVAYLTAWTFDGFYTICVIPPEYVARANEDCLSNASPEEREWALQAFETGEYLDETFSVEAGDAAVGNILCFWDKEGKLVKVFAFSPYY